MLFYVRMLNTRKWTSIRVLSIPYVFIGRRNTALEFSRYNWMNELYLDTGSLRVKCSSREPCNTYIQGKLFCYSSLSQTQKNICEPQTGIEPTTFWSPVRRSNHWATRTQMAERRPRCVPVRMRDTAVSICQYILLTNIYIYMSPCESW